MPSRREAMNYIACSASSSFSPRSPIVCRRFYTPATTGLSCDFILDEVADDHHIVADTNTSTTPVSAPPVHARTTRVPENNAHCIHGVHCIDMTRQDEDELFPSGNGSGPSPSAFAAVSHYPYVEPGESERLAMNEVINVNAVVGSERHPRESEGARRRGGAAGRREEDYAVEDENWRGSNVGMRSFAPSDCDVEDYEEEEEEDLDDARKLYPDVVARSGDEVPDGGVSLTGVSDVGYANSRWDEYGNIPSDYEDSQYEDEDYEHERERVHEDDESLSEEEEDDEEAHDQRVMQSLYEMEEISGRAIQAGIDFAGANPLEMVDMIADFANEFPVTTYERNFTVDQFIDQWLYQTHRFPYNRASHPLNMNRPEKVVRPSGHDNLDFFDLQQINWERLRAKRSDARAQRDFWYRPYHNVEHAPQDKAKLIHRPEFYFREKAMYTKHRASIEHFQLRNLMSVPAYNTVHFANESRLLSWVPAYDDLTCLIDLSRPPKDTVLEGPVKISTMKSALGISVVGGFAGEYAVHADTLSSTSPGPGIPNTAGYVTRDLNGITNHIDIIPHRTSHSPTAIFASNDNHLRVLDCETDTFTSDVDLSRAVNCTSTSPDGRLRVIVGDSPEALILEADTGRPVRPLHAHRDFGFACAWSPDMWHIATANQDKTTIIWDVRMWRPLTMLAADVSGYRSLKFSPIGGGERSLLMVEPADRVTLANASTYESRQVHDFFGEIAGADFSPDGAGVWVANADEIYGGFMEFERRIWGGKSGPGLGDGHLGGGFDSAAAAAAADTGDGPRVSNDWVDEDGLDADERCTMGNQRERGFRFLRNWSDEEYETLLL